MEQNSAVSPLLIDWYLIHKRDLPWRNSTDPYRIWISEIILQQTRVDQGLEYYNRFIETFPDVKQLAKAPEQAVLKLWQGLGYYSRARNLHATAQIIVDHFNGKFPHTYSDILGLKGIGPYTAAAIASFAFKLPYPVIDGNVMRVVSRFFDLNLPIDQPDGKKEIQRLTAAIFNKEQPDQHNQAIMDFGALQCIPHNPDCEICPLMNYCLAYKNETVSLRPIKTAKIKIRHRYFHYAIINAPEGLVMKKRSGRDIWQHLFEFPLIELPSRSKKPKSSQFVDLLNGQLINPEFVNSSDWDLQVLSHQHIHAKFWHFMVTGFDVLPSSEYQLISEKDMADIPVPKLIERHMHDS